MTVGALVPQCPGRPRSAERFFGIFENEVWLFLWV